VWHLAEVFDPPSDSYETMGSWCEWHLAEREVPPSDNGRVRGILEGVSLTVWANPLGGICNREEI